MSDNTFYIYRWSSSTKFSNTLNAPDLLMLWIIQWQSTFLNSDNGNIAYIKTWNLQIMAIIRYRNLNLNPRLKN